MAGHDNSVGGKESDVQAKDSETTPTPLLGIPQEQQAIPHKIFADDLAQTHTWSVFVNIMLLYLLGPVLNHVVLN